MKVESLVILNGGWKFILFYVILGWGVECFYKYN